MCPHLTKPPPPSLRRPLWPLTGILNIIRLSYAVLYVAYVQIGFCMARTTIGTYGSSIVLERLITYRYTYRPTLPLPICDLYFCWSVCIFTCSLCASVIMQFCRAYL